MIGTQETTMKAKVNTVKAIRPRPTVYASDSEAWTIVMEDDCHMYWQSSFGELPTVGEKIDDVFVCRNKEHEHPRAR
jgi:hypothetical protein